MTKEKNLGGRPKTVLTDEQIAQVEALAAYLSISDIAYFLDISPRNFLDIKNRDPRVEEAYKRGKAKAISFVASKLMNIIREEENTPTKLSAIIFYSIGISKFVTRKVVNQNFKNLFNKM